MIKNIGSAHVLAAAALFVALGGTAVANDSVRALITGAQVRDNSLTGRDVRDRSLTGRDLRDRTVTAADLAPGVVRAGPAGPAGAQGPRGETGAVGPAGPDLAGATHVRVRGDRTPAENGHALRAALGAITDASATRPYALQLAAGVYELGDTTLAMKPYVSISGTDADVTRITGGQGQSALGQALVHGADGTVLRDVTVLNSSDVRTPFHSVLAVSGGARMRIEDAVLEGRTTGARANALTAAGGSFVEVDDSRLTSGSDENPSAAIAIEGSDFRIRGSELVAQGARLAFTLTARDAGSTAVVESSSIVSSFIAVNGAGGSVTVGASRVVGTPSGGVTCVASYDGNFAPLGGNCA
jgi:hypothetical protein